MNSVRPIKPKRWVRLLISSISPLSETLYAPSLPDIAKFFNVSASYIEYSLTVYLATVAFGMLFWGRLSDSIGRRICVLYGLIIYIIGCFGCSFSNSIDMFFIFRGVQGFGASVGSVLAQAITRDVFSDKQLAIEYAFIGMFIPIFTISGTFFGGRIAEYLDWYYAFRFLIVYGFFVSMVSYFKLNETNYEIEKSSISLSSLSYQMLTDKLVIGSGLTIGLVRGVMFSYCAESPFIMIKIIGISPSVYGESFALIGLGAFLGGYVARLVNKNFGIITSLLSGIMITTFSLVTMSLSINIIGSYYDLSHGISMCIIIISMAGYLFGMTLVNTGIITVAIQRYDHHIAGTASAILNTIAYIVISCTTVGMSLFHNGKITAMPSYFFCIAILIILIFKNLVYDAIIDKKK